MQATSTLVSVGLIAALLSTPVLAGKRAHAMHDDGQHARHARHVQQAQTGPWEAVAHEAKSGEPGQGWQYFHDAVAQRAVVISPTGDYYYSRGQGLRWLAAASGPV